MTGTTESCSEGYHEYCEYPKDCNCACHKYMRDAIKCHNGFFYHEYMRRKSMEEPRDDKKTEPAAIRDLSSKSPITISTEVDPNFKEETEEEGSKDSDSGTRVDESAD